MTLLARIVCLLLLVASAPGFTDNVSQALEPDVDFSPDQAASAHPAQMYFYAGRLLETADMNEAAFWFCAGQLRYRVHLLARPDLPADRDPALFASLNAVLGQEINEYLSGDPDEWERLIERVLNWDANTPNGFTPKSEFPAAYSEVRAGLTELRKMVHDNHEALKKAAADRAADDR